MKIWQYELVGFKRGGQIFLLVHRSGLITLLNNHFLMWGEIRFDNSINHAGEIIGGSIRILQHEMTEGFKREGTDANYYYWYTDQV